MSLNIYEVSNRSQNNNKYLIIKIEFKLIQCVLSNKNCQYNIGSVLIKCTRAFQQIMSVQMMVFVSKASVGVTMRGCSPLTPDYCEGIIRETTATR
jgi:hypothetical protein